jgi:hypothetical protein
MPSQLGRIGLNSSQILNGFFILVNFSSFDDFDLNRKKSKNNDPGINQADPPET